VGAWTKELREKPTTPWTYFPISRLRIEVLGEMKQATGGEGKFKETGGAGHGITLTVFSSPAPNPPPHRATQPLRFHYFFNLLDQPISWCVGNKSWAYFRFIHKTQKMFFGPNVMRPAFGPRNAIVVHSDSLLSPPLLPHRIPWIWSSVPTAR